MKKFFTDLLYSYKFALGYYPKLIKENKIYIISLVFDLLLMPIKLIFVMFVARTETGRRILLKIYDLTIGKQES